MTRVKILALLVGMVLLFTLPATVSAQRVPPHVFVVTSVDGAAPADGTVIAALVDGAEVASETAAGGQAVVTVDQGDSSFAGSTVTFTINGATAAETAVWEQGGADIMELTGGAPAATATPIPGPEALATGVPGRRGPTGDKGDKGDKGDSGPQGPTGAQGPTGPGGPGGVQGADGATGPAGAAGAKGSSGPAGPAGAKGATGGEGSGGGGGALAVVALILAIVAIAGAGGAFVLGRRA